MAVFVGTGARSFDLVAKGASITRSLVREVVDQMVRPAIGELKFVSTSPSLASLGLEQSGGVWRHSAGRDFAGWTLPDGKSYSSADFPEAARVYGDRGGYFVLPNLAAGGGTFVKGSSSALSQPDPTPAQSAVALHQHSLQASAEGSAVKMTLPKSFVFCAAGNPGKGRMKTYYTHPAIYYMNRLTGLHRYEGKEIGAHQLASLDSSNVSADINYEYYNGGAANKEGGYYPSPSWLSQHGDSFGQWSMPYSVPALHSGDHVTIKGNKYHAPFPIDMHMDSSAVQAMFQGGATDDASAGSGDFAPESTTLNAMIYIGRKRAS